MHKHASDSHLACGYYANFHAYWRPDPPEEPTVPGKVKRRMRHVKNRKNKRK